MGTSCSLSIPFKIRVAYNVRVGGTDILEPVNAFQIRGAYNWRGVPHPVTAFQIQDVYKVFLTCLPFTNPVATLQISGVYNVEGLT